MTPHDTFFEFAADLKQFMEDSVREPQAFPNQEARFNALALRLFALQFDANKPFRKFCEAADRTPGGIHRWQEIPAVPAAGFKDSPLTCLAETERSHVFFSSGSTSTLPSRHFHSHASLAIYEASLWTWFRAHLLPAGPPAPGLLVLTPSPPQAPNSSLVHMMECVRRQMGAPEEVFAGHTTDDGAWRLSVEDVIKGIRSGNDTQTPIMLLGTAFSLVHLVEELEQRALRLRLPPESRIMETGGYKGRSRALPKAQLYAKIRELLGVSSQAIVSEYGMSELSSQGYDGVAGTTSRRTLAFPPWARAQVICPETDLPLGAGGTGLIRVLDLANTYSAMHVQTEDLGCNAEGGFNLIGRVQNAEPRGCSLIMQ